MRKPLLSVIIPTFNRAVMLERCLECFAKQTFPRQQFEVIVIDDGSQDGTKAVLHEKNFLFLLHPILQDHGGAAKARNQGIRAAVGGTLVFTDDDCLPVPSFLEHHWLAHRKPNRLARGPILIVRSFKEAARTKPSPFSFSMNFFCTSNASLSKDKVLAAGGFDESFDRWEDAELGFRLRKLGLKMFFAMHAVVHHLKPVRRLRDLLETAFKDGQSAQKVFRAHPSLRTWLSGGLDPFSRAAGMALKPAVDLKVARMDPDDLVNGLWERLIFHHYFVKGLRG